MNRMATLNRLISTIVLTVLFFAGNSQDFNNIEFVENKGQWDNRVKFKGTIDAGAIFITTSGFTILKHNEQDFAALQSLYHGHDQQAAAKLERADGTKVIRSHALTVDFIDASPSMQVVAEKVIPSYNNYFIGDDPSKWGSECRIYQVVTLKEVYPGIDVRYYTYNGRLKYDIVAKPGADISKIALRYKGAKIRAKNKELVVSTSLGDFNEPYPYTYQTGLKERREISNKYVVKDDVVRFDVKGYDRNEILVIDPTPIFCSFSNSTANNWGFTATYGPDGSFYGGGIVFEGGSFPVNTGAFQTSFQGGEFDIGIIKLTANGGNRVYATYIGGNGDDQPHSLVVNPQGELIVAGRTNSPLTGPDAYPVAGANIGSCGGWDIVVTKLNAAGSNMIGSKRIGGTSDDGVNIKAGRTGVSSLERNYGDDGRSEVIVDGAGNIYVASCTKSNQSGPVNGFPSTGAFQTAFGGGTQDGVLLKFNPDLSTNLFASYIGGSGNDAAYVLALSPSGDIYVAGGTEQGNNATDFPGSHAGTIGPSSHGGIDGFVAQVTNNGSAIIRSSYFGTAGIDQVYGIQFDRSGFPYIMGQTTGAWPVVNATYSNPGGKQFISKLQPNLSAYVYSTVFGTGAANPNISPTAFLVDRCENVYVSGWGGPINSTNPSEYPSAGTSGLPVTADASSPPVLKSTTDGTDFYFFVLKRDAVSQLFGSFFGQNGGFADHVDGGTSRFDVNGVIYQGVCANCGGTGVFPTTPGVWGPSKPASAFCNLGMVKIAFNLAGVGSDVGASIGGVPNDTAGCFPLDVTFTDQIRNATEYIWNFGDGSGDIGPLPAATGYTQTHTFTAVGNYRVMLVAINPTSCNIRDTSYINIRVGDLRANLDANYVKLDPCEAFNYQFNNLSTTNPIRPFTNTSFSWDFGDGSPLVVAGLNPVTHVYTAPGTYHAMLILHDTAYCNDPDSFPLEVRVAANLEASFETDPFGCAPHTALFSYTGVGGQTFEWDFGDPGSPDNTSTLSNPTHVYNNPGSYNIVLIVTDPNTCNVTDTARLTFVVYEKPTALFSYTPTTPVVNTPHIFTNLSSPNATRFKWLFGDGDTLATTSRGDVTHQYNATGTFNACLVAFNNVGCSDTFCLDVEALIEPALDVPNAFTPNSGDVNSIVMVRGFGISKMRFIIWNRWGQKVFETGNFKQGWNGKVNGVVQPMDVYAYTLEVEFFDGKKVTRTGDITLIR